MLFRSDAHVVAVPDADHVADPEALAHAVVHDPRRLMRRAGPGDLEALLPLVRGYCEADAHVYDEEKVRRAMAPLLEDDSLGQVWLLGDAEPIGYCVVTWGHSIESGGREALLDEFFVRDGGQGTGGAAMPAILAAAREAGAVRMFLETETANERARTFYARHGFAVEDSVWMSIDL